MTLAETQALFHDVITSKEPPGSSRIEDCFAGTAPFPASDRVGVYASMYLWRLIEALRETFPNLARYLGEDTFATLAEDYVRRHPSEHHDVAQAGRRLPAFLREHPDPERPDLADLAELEWGRNVVFFAASVAPAGPEVLAGLAPEAFARTGLTLSPALRVLLLDHAATPLWRRLRDGEAPDPPVPGISPVAVWRSGSEVFHRPLTQDEAIALEGAAHGDSLAQICSAFADRDDPAVAAHGAISGWIAEGWVVGLAT